MDASNYLQFFFAFIFVLALMGGLALILKKLGLDHGGSFAGNNKRLKLIETTPIDAKRKLALIEQDSKQHLLLLGPSGDTVIKTDITPPQKKQDDKK